MGNQYNYATGCCFQLGSDCVLSFCFLCGDGPATRSTGHQRLVEHSASGLTRPKVHAHIFSCRFTLMAQLKLPDYSAHELLKQDPI